MRAGLQPLSFEQLVLRPELGEALLQLRPDRGHGALHTRAGGDEVRRRVDRAAGQRDDGVARERVDPADALDGIAPQLDPHGLLVVSGQDLDRVAPHAERSPLQRDVVPDVLHGHQRLQDRVAAAIVTHLHGDEELAVQLRVAQAVDRRNARDDDHVVALHEAGRGAQPQRFELALFR